jgi:tetratricopeptide (TPR) repeat protein
MRFDRRAIPWESVVTVLLLACAAVPLRTRAKGVLATDRAAYCREESDFHNERGDALRQGVPLPGIAWAMPFYSVPNGYLCYRLTPAASGGVRSGVLLAGAVLVFALGVFLYSAPCGAGAVFLYALLPSSGAGGERWLYALTVLFAAYFLVRRARAPSLAASVGLGAAIGASLLVLSPLFLLPFLLVLYECSRDRKIGAARLRDAGALLLVPFLFLIPWIVMNWRLSGRFVLFENGRADDNIITGALGFVRTMGSGDSRALAAISAGQNILLWAAGEILRHPLRYLAALFARLGYVASLHPLLVLASTGSVWLARKREDCRQFALLAAYFFAIHILMPVQASYFVPMWPLLAVLASGLFAGWTRPASEKMKTASTAAVVLVFALLLAAQACVLGLVWAYPARVGEPDALARAIARDPDDPWLWSQRGMGLLSAGLAQEAAGDLARAFALDPQKDREIRYAWALLASGDPLGARILERLKPEDDAMVINLRARVLRAIALALDGRRSEALAAMDSALEFERSSSAVTSSLPRIVREIASSWPAAKLPAIIEAFESFPALRPALGEKTLAKAWTDAARLDLAAGDRRLALKTGGRTEKAGLDDEMKFREADSDRLERGHLEQADLLLEMSFRAEKCGRWPKALELLELAEKNVSAAPERLRRAFVVAPEDESYGRALDALKRLKREGWENADLVLDLGVRAAESGRRPAALEVLAFAEDMRLDSERTRRLAQAYEGLGDPLGSSRVLLRLRDDAGGWLDRAESAAAAGDRASAQSSAAHARGLSLIDGDARRLLLLDQGLGEYARALEFANSRVLARPDDARWRNDRGVVHALMGDSEAAVADWKAALALDPDLLTPYLSLGSFYVSANRRKEASALYQKALQRPRIKNDAEASRLISAGR